MKPNLLRPLVAALATTICTAASAAPTYQFRQHVAGLAVPASPASPESAVPAAPIIPTLVGNGVSKAGACTVGTATGCATWGSSFYTGTIFSSDYLTATPLPDVMYGTRATKTITTGKWYWEITLNAPMATATTKIPALIGVEAVDRAPGNWTGSSGNGKIWAGYYGSFYSCASTWLWPSMKNQPRFYKDDVIAVALDMDNHTLALTLNGTALTNSAGGTPLCSNLYGTVVPVVSNGGGDFSVTANFGQSDFQYPVPAGYNAGLW